MNLTFVDSSLYFLFKKPNSNSLHSGSSKAGKTSLFKKYFLVSVHCICLLAFARKINKFKFIVFVFLQYRRQRWSVTKEVFQ